MPLRGAPAARRLNDLANQVGSFQRFPQEGALPEVDNRPFGPGADEGSGVSDEKESRLNSRSGNVVYLHCSAALVLQNLYHAL